MVTKDEDFRNLHLLKKRPRKLLHVTCGNISTADLLALFDRYRGQLEMAIQKYDYVELDRHGVIFHDIS